jgi:monoamine oxidase
MDRRTFLQSAAAVPAMLALQGSFARRVIVVGGGLAGLAAAYELGRAGFDVTILEARTRPGGRVHTMREPFSDGLYAEAGASRIQDSHAFTLRYVKQFNLTLDPFWPTEGATVSRVAGQRILGPPRMPVDLAKVPLPFSEDEKQRGHIGCLADKILYGAPVARLEQDTAGVRATYLRGETPVTVSGDYLVCAIPLPVMRRVEIWPALSPVKRTAIQEVGFMPMARVFLQSRRRFWLDRGESGWASTDDPIDVWDYTRDQPGPRGILGAYTSGRMAQQITARDPAARGPFVLEMMERVHPGIREHCEGSASYSWISDPWALGAAADFTSGQLSKFYGPLRAPEGRFHFAGEHTSPWGGWMNGGLESGNRVADEIRARV